MIQNEPCMIPQVTFGIVVHYRQERIELDIYQCCDHYMNAVPCNELLVITEDINHDKWLLVQQVLIQ